MPQKALRAKECHEVDRKYCAGRSRRRLSKIVFEAMKLVEFKIGLIESHPMHRK